MTDIVEKKKPKHIRPSRAAYVAARRAAQKANGIDKDKEYYEKNKEKSNARSARNYQKRKDEILAKQKADREANPEKYAERARLYNLKNKNIIKIKRKEKYEKNKEYVLKQGKEYYENNKESYLESCKTYRKNNLAKYAAQAAKRRAQKLLATPKWANLELVQEYYDTAHGLSMCVGEWYHVDHVIPLVHELVCGLHNQFNLQVLIGEENLSKSNKFVIK